MKLTRAYGNFSAELPGSWQGEEGIPVDVYYEFAEEEDPHITAKTPDGALLTLTDYEYQSLVRMAEVDFKYKLEMSED